MIERTVITAVPPADESSAIVVSLTGSKYTTLRYNAVVLEGIRRYVVNKFQSIPRGGLEVGGLLIGRVAGESIEITESVEFTIEYASGPAYVLTSGDEENLREQLQGTSDVVGWWHSHTRSEADLSDEDLRVHREFFPDEHSVALIVKPFKFDPAHAAVFLPNAAEDAFLACARFELEAPDTRSRPVVPASPDPKAEPNALASVVVPMPLRPLERPPERPAGRRWVALMSGAAVVLALAGASWFASRPGSVEKPAQALALTVSETGNHLTVQWNRDAGAIRSSIGGELTVLDGPHITRIPMGVDSLNSGTLSYVRRSDRVEVRLRTTSTDNQLNEVVAHFIGPAPDPVTVTRHETTPPKQDYAEVKRMREEMERLNSELARMRSTAKPAPMPAPVPVRQSASRAMTPPPQRTQLQQTQPQQTSPQQQTVAAAVPSTVPALPVVQPGTLPAAPAISQQSIIAPPPAAPTPAAPTPAAPKQLARGKAIWTGTLPRGSVLLVDGRRPSAGALTGRMPDGPSRMRIYSADLRESGIVVYTQTDKERIETPSAANGWNLTTYRPDTKRARDITVLESPNSANNWQRIMVRSEQRPLSMLVLEWEEFR